MSFYAVANGREIGIFSNWNDCNESVKGFKNAKFKKFSSSLDAQTFINNYKMDNTDKIVFDDFEPDFYVYTDGACSNNGKADSLSGIGIFFGINDQRNLSKKLDGKQTNNTAELTAIIEAYYIIKSDLDNNKKIAIVSDSQYAIRCLTSYGDKCYNKNWNTDIPNKELVKQAFELYRNITNIKFIHIKAHTNNNDIHSIGNFNADKLANIAIGLDKCPYLKK